MKHCSSCGGILGRDCFNPIECAQITESMNIIQYEQQEKPTNELWQYIHMLESRIELLEQKLNPND